MQSNLPTDETRASCPDFGGSSEAMLRSEIDFWRQLIDHCQELPQPSGVVERMRQALALAEFRLAALFRTRPSSQHDCPELPDNVHYLR